MNKLFAKLGLAAVLFAAPFVSVQAGAGNNHAAVFLGATSTDDSTDPTVGLEYEYRLPYVNRMFGIGVVGEGIFSDPKALIGVAGVIVHPWKDLKLNLSFGKERKAGHDVDVTRVGIGYDFHYNSISYGPVYNMDSIHGHTVHVAGIAVGIGF